MKWSKYENFKGSFRKNTMLSGIKKNNQKKAGNVIIAMVENCNFTISQNKNSKSILS